jgi:hypothetical protein
MRNHEESTELDLGSDEQDLANELKGLASAGYYFNQVP